MHVLSTVAHALGQGLFSSWSLFWESFYGLTFGFVISAIVQVLVPQELLRRYIGGGVRGIAAAAGFGIVSSSCSYGSAAAARSLYQKGADARSTFSFLISSTNMNVAILILFWVLVGWKFAFAEFFGGIIIIAVVAAGLTILFPGAELDRLRQQLPVRALPGTVTEDLICGMKGHREYAAEFGGRTYLFCNEQHARQFRANPEEYAGASGAALAKGPGAMAVRPVESRDFVCGMEGSTDHVHQHAGRDYLFCSSGCREAFAAEPSRFLPQTPAVAPPAQTPSIWSLRAWYEVAQRAVGDVKMLRTELLTGYLLAGFAAALIPHQWFSHSLSAIGGVPVIGYVLLLLVGLGIAVATFVCSMGNVPVAAFLKSAGTPLGANTAYIYGDLLILPLVQIYRKSFAPRLTAAFLGLFVIGACLAGGLMEAIFRLLPGAT